MLIKFANRLDTFSCTSNNLPLEEQETSLWSCPLSNRVFRRIHTAENIFYHLYHLRTLLTSFHRGKFSLLDFGNIVGNLFSLHLAPVFLLRRDLFSFESMVPKEAWGRKSHFEVMSVSRRPWQCARWWENNQLLVPNSRIKQYNTGIKRHKLME